MFTNSEVAPKFLLRRTGRLRQKGDLRPVRAVGRLSLGFADVRGARSAGGEFRSPDDGRGGRYAKSATRERLKSRQSISKATSRD